MNRISRRAAHTIFRRLGNEVIYADTDSCAKSLLRILLKRLKSAYGWAELQQGKTAVEISLAELFILEAVSKSKSFEIIVVSAIPRDQLRDQTWSRFFFGTCQDMGKPIGAELGYLVRHLIGEGKIGSECEVRVIHLFELPSLQLKKVNWRLIIVDEGDQSNIENGVLERDLYRKVGINQNVSPSEWKDVDGTTNFLAKFSATPWDAMIHRLTQGPNPSFGFVRLSRSPEYCGLEENYERGRYLQLDGNSVITKREIHKNYQKTLNDYIVACVMAQPYPKLHFVDGALIVEESSDSETCLDMDTLLAKYCEANPEESEKVSRHLYWKQKLDCEQGCMSDQWEKEIIPRFQNENIMWGTGYLVVRLWGPEVDICREWCKKNGFAFQQGTCDWRSKHNDDVMSISDIQNRLQEQPLVPTILVISGSYRAGMTLPSKHFIRGAVERKAPRATTDSIVQAWVGRACGYGKTNDVYPIWCDVGSVKEVIEAYRKIRALPTHSEEMPDAVPSGRNNRAANGTDSIRWQMIPIPIRGNTLKTGDSLESFCRENGFESSQGYEIGKKKIASDNKVESNLYEEVMKGNARSTVGHGLLVYWVGEEKPINPEYIASWEKAKEQGILGNNFIFTKTSLALPKKYLKKRSALK